MIHGIKTIKDIKARCYIDEDGCWIWKGSNNGNGTPVANINSGTYVTVLRYAYCLKKGIDYESLKGLRVWSRTRVPSDVNPDHAMVGTIAEHNRWRAEGGRLTGLRRSIIAIKARDKVGRRFTAEQVEAIRASDETEQVLGLRYGCSGTLIGQIRRRQIYNGAGAAASVFTWAAAA